MKNIKSTDPRKAVIVDALKKASNCRKVTNVRENGPGKFVGDCMWPNPGDAYTGTVQVKLDCHCHDGSFHSLPCCAHGAEVR